MQSALQRRLQVHLAFRRVLDKVGIDDDLVGLAEAEVNRVLLYQLTILL